MDEFFVSLPRIMRMHGFAVIPVKFNMDCFAGHNLFVKDHNLSREVDPRRPNDRTLYVVNVPPYYNEESLRRIFCDYGKILQVIIQDELSLSTNNDGESKFFKKIETAKGFSAAYVVFNQAGSLKTAKQMSLGQPRVLSTGEKRVYAGMNKWLPEYAAYHTLDTTELQKDIDKYMADFDKKKLEVEEHEKTMDGVPDEYGWVTVTRQGKNKGIPRTEAAEKKILAKEKKMRKEKELLNFYSFQTRESKREHIADMRKKFEEDKQRIVQMKTARKFRPY
ncbi:ribosomal RNA-processing protein 7 homolog A-like isoform X2 [Lineus longissimus]|uniref:ribosomal RNA-processing protein 7 homolog A-like isoform X2 n=1 Tax=Lineus longissimus TaxID=88925 RepID=UPI002B4E2E33